MPVGISDPQLTDIVNGGDKAVTVKSVTPPMGTYRAIGLPKVGTVIKPGEAIPVGVVFTPQHNVTTNGSFTITPSQGTSVTVSLTGTGLPPFTKFTASPVVRKTRPGPPSVRLPPVTHAVRRSTASRPRKLWSGSTTVSLHDT